MWGSIAEADD